MRVAAVAAEGSQGFEIVARSTIMLGLRHNYLCSFHHWGFLQLLRAYLVVVASIDMKEGKVEL